MVKLMKHAFQLEPCSRALNPPHGRALYFLLAGNANDTEPIENGPPRVRAQELCQELDPLFEIVQLREFRFDGVVVNEQMLSPLGWSAVLRRRKS